MHIEPNESETTDYFNWLWQLNYSVSLPEVVPPLHVVHLPRLIPQNTHAEITLSSVSFDDSFITRVYTDPAPTLAAYDSLWKEEVFTLVSDWHRYSATPLDNAAIKAHLRAIIDQNEEERNSHPVVRLRDRIMAQTIDRERGRETLISLIHECHRSYAETYNALELET